MAGKFDSDRDQRIYALSLDGCDIEAGDSSEDVWVGLVTQLSECEIADCSGVECDHETGHFSAVIVEYSSGFVGVTEYQNEGEARTAFDSFVETIPA